MVDILRFYAGLASEVKGKTIPWAPSRFLYTKRVPVGVVGGIIPWNAPLMQSACKIGPALAAGNTVVLKTAEQAPLAVLRVFELIQEILPPGVANVISGFGEEAGKPLVKHPKVRKITFTGSSAVGAEIMRDAADKFISVTAELGGKNPNIVMPDADLDLAVPGIIQGLRLFRQGQSCTAGTRIYIHEDVYRPVMDRVIAEIGNGRLGNPLDDATEVGAVISAEQLARIERYVEMARQTPGAKILVGGERPGDEALRHGHFYLPTLIEGIPADSPVCREEIFGPIATVALMARFRRGDRRGQRFPLRAGGRAVDARPRPFDGFHRPDRGRLRPGQPVLRGRSEHRIRRHQDQRHGPRTVAREHGGAFHLVEDGDHQFRHAGRLTKTIQRKGG